MLANILAPFQVMGELTAGFKHLDCFVIWPDNHDIEQEATHCQSCKGSRQVQVRGRFGQHTQMLQPADVHERLTYARLHGGLAGTTQGHRQTESAERHVCSQTAYPHKRVIWTRL